MRHRDGRSVWIRIRGTVVLWTPDGHPLRMTGTHEDVTDVVRARSALAESEKRYRDLVDALPDPTYVFSAVRDDDGALVDLTYTHLNQAAAASYRRSVHDTVGQTLLSLFPSLGLLGVIDFCNHTLVTRLPATCRYRSLMRTA